MGEKSSYLAICIFGAAIFCFAATVPAATSDGEFELRPVRESSSGLSFQYEYRLIAQEEHYRVYSIRFPSPVMTDVSSNNVVPGELFIPLGADARTPVPAVICLHILSGNRDLMELVCTALASRGIAAFMFRLPFYGERGGPEGPRLLLRQPVLFMQAVEQGWGDARRAVDLLSSLPEIHPERISVLGISLGGITAFGIAAHEPRIWRVLAILAGGNLPEILEHARETQTIRQALDQMSEKDREDFLRLVRSSDPLVHAAKLRDKAAAGRVHLINATEDEVIPRKCTEELIAALGPGVTVSWIEGVGHYSAISKLPQIVEETVAFFAQDLETKPQASISRQAAERPAQFILAEFLQGLSKLLSGEATGKKRYRVALAGWVKKRQASEEVIRFSIDFARAEAGRFRLSGEIPQVGQVAFGQDQYPWIFSTTGMLFVGSLLREGEIIPDSGRSSLEPEKASLAASVDKRALPAEGEASKVLACPQDPLRFAKREYLDQLGMVSGILAAAALAPRLLANQEVTVDSLDGPSGPALVVKARKFGPAEVQLRFQPDGKTPRKIGFQISEWEGDLDIGLWQIEEPVPDSHFAPPDVPHKTEVPCYEMHRVFGAVFNFLGSSLTGN